LGHFAEAALDETLHRHARSLSRLTRAFAPGLFASELQLVRALGECSTVREVHAIYWKNRESGARSSARLLARLGLRISFERLMRLTVEVFDRTE
jgi:hypothetical protein